MEHNVMTKYIRCVLVLVTAVMAAACTMTDAIHRRWPGRRR